MSDYFSSDNQELLQDFFIEAEQQVEKLEQNILAMESDPTDHDAIDEIFRAAHTLKGGAATVHMDELAEFTHAVEDLLDSIRSGTCTPNGDVIDCLLLALDVTKSMLENRKGGTIYQEDVKDLKVRLRSFIGDPKKGKAPQGVPAAVKEKSVAPKVSASTEKVDILAEGPSTAMTAEELKEMKEMATSDSSVYLVRIDFDPENPMNSVGGIQVFAVLKGMGQVLRTYPDFDALYEDNFYPVVDYYLLSNEAPDYIEKRSHLSDVTLKATVVAGDTLNIENVADTTVVEEQVIPAPVEVVPEVLEVVPVATEMAKPVVAEGKSSTAQPKKTENQAQILRVDSKRIDTLLNLVSELVITKGTFNQATNQMGDVLYTFQASRNSMQSITKELIDMVPEMIAGAADGKMSMADVRKELNTRLMRLHTVIDNFEGKLKAVNGKIKSMTSELGRTTGELHEGVLKIRMVPVDQVFQRFPRLVRDLAKSLNKEVHLEIIGGETEMDKTVTEELVDPLMHCVRNSMDHGIEGPSERLSLGKKSEGHLTLKASNQGNMVVVEIIDDGHGIDPEKIRAKAIERGIIHASKNLSEQEIFGLIMEPGFSTAEKITNISGRGVGLDVVKRSIEKLNGEISISSVYGKGSTFTIKLPLTLAIIQGLLVRVGRDTYAIPITSVLESFRIHSNDIAILDGHEVFNVRNNVISVLRMAKIFGVERQSESKNRFLVVVGTEEKKLGLLVDELIGEEDVVIKPLKDSYTNCPGIAGATIMGDGTVSLIVDIGQLLNLGFKQEMVAVEKRTQEMLKAGL